MSDAAGNYEAMRRSLNHHRELITRTIRVYKFFDKLRSHNVLTLEDYEEIDNSSRYCTGAEKAGHLLDVIDTRGPNGLNVFIQCLDDNYPDLYEKVTGLESSPRTYVRTPDVVAISHPFIDIEGVQKLSAQLDELSMMRAQDQLAITELREELLRLRFINTTCRTKLKKYPHLVKKQKQLDLEFQELKEENSNLQLRILALEKERSKLKFERKEHKQMIDQLKQKLEDAVNMHTSQKHNWERTNSKNEQLADDKNNLEKKLEHMKREIETVKRQSSLWSNKSFQISEDHLDQGEMQATIDILKSDKEMLKSENSELVNRLYKERNSTEKIEMKFEKMKAEYEELNHLLRVMQKDLTATDKHYKLTWQELQKVSAERNQAFEQRRRAQMEAQESCKERDRLQETLNQQLMNFKENMYNKTTRSTDKITLDEDFLRPDMGGFSRHRQLRVSGYSDISGMSSDRATVGSDHEVARKSATLPLVTRGSSPSFLNGGPIPDMDDPLLQNEGEEASFHRPRTKRILTGSSGKGSQYNNGQNPFDEKDFPSYSGTDTKKEIKKKEKEEERADFEVCKKGCVTPEEVTKNWAERHPNFSESLRSNLANRGSNKARDHHKVVDLWIMKQSFKVRPPLNSSFSIDYDDEDEDLKAIFDNGHDSMDDAKRRKKLYRRSRSLDDLMDDLNVSSCSDESEESRRMGDNEERPSRRKMSSRPRHRFGGIFTDNRMTPKIYKILWGSQSSLLDDRD